jgi:drug/metabolite transporter (DMT)-like permease
LPIAVTETKILPAGLYEQGYLALYGMLTFAGYTLYNSALAKLPTTMVAISGYGQPVIATGLALLLLGEVPSLTSLIGGSIVVAGLAIATLGQISREPAKRATEP